MRLQFIHRVKFVVLPILALAIGFGAGCGGDSGGDPEPTPECAISAVNTGLDDSWLTGEEVNIRWTHNGVPGTVDIALLKGGAPVSTIATATGNDGFFSWTQASTGGQANGADVFENLIRVERSHLLGGAGRSEQAGRDLVDLLVGGLG